MEYVFSTHINNDFVFPAWKCGDAPRLYNAVQIDAGQGQVVARDTSSYVYFLIGAYWQRMTTSVRFRHVSVGPAGLWGSGTTNKVYKYVAGNFLPSTGNYHYYYYYYYFHMNKYSLYGFPWSSSFILLSLLYNIKVLVQHSAPTT